MQEGVLDREGARLHWWLSPGGATAPLVVCTHGGAMDHRMWDPQVNELASQHRVLTHDVRGHGLSSSPASTFSVDAAAEDLIALIDTAGAEKVVLIGHSVGASISQLVALHHPDRVGALIGIGAACITMPATATARLRQAVNPLALGLLGQKRVRAMFAEMAGVTPAVKSYARETIDALGRRCLCGRDADGLRPDTRRAERLPAGRAAPLAPGRPRALLRLPGDNAAVGRSR